MSKADYSTPHYHLSPSEKELVYEPSEDTFLLLDALESDIHELKSIKRTVCVEIGSGIGVVTCFLASILGKDIAYLCTDLNSTAVEVTKRTAQLNNHLEIVLPVVTDLVQCFVPHIFGKVDIILFNPPYVPTEPEEVVGSGLSRAWAGGAHGRELLQNLFPLIPNEFCASGKLI